MIRNCKVRIVIILHELQEGFLPEKRRFQSGIARLVVVDGEREREAGGLTVILLCMRKREQKYLLVKNKMSLRQKE